MKLADGWEDESYLPPSKWTSAGRFSSEQRLSDIGSFIDDSPYFRLNDNFPSEDFFSLVVGSFIHGGGYTHYSFGPDSKVSDQLSRSVSFLQAVTECITMEVQTILNTRFGEEISERFTSNMLFSLFRMKINSIICKVCPMSLDHLTTLLKRLVAILLWVLYLGLLFLIHIITTLLLEQT